MAEIEARLTHEKLAVADAIDRVSDGGCGGIAVFIGTVRESPAAGGRAEKPVVRLDYEAHPELAEHQLNEVARAAADRWGVRKIVAVHRTGACELGEPTVVIACAAPHRAAALEACRWMIDTIKATVPIWKREVYADGSSWVGAEGEAR